MICQNFADQQMAERYLKGQLEDSQRDQFELHILECPDCLNALETLKDLRFALQSQAHEIRLAPERSAAKFWKWSLVAAASLALLFAVGMIQRRRQSPGPGSNIATQPLPGYQVPAPAHTENAPSPAPAESAQTTKAPVSQPPVKRDSADRSTKLARKQPEPVSVQPSLQAPVETTPPLAEVASATQPAQPAKTKKKSGADEQQLTSDQAVELYHLGEVRPAPFTFAGIKSTRPSSPGLGAMAGAGHDSASSTFQLAMASYVEGNYREASSILEMASQSEPGAPNINFYLGVCRLMLGHPESAIPVLNKVTSEARSRLVQPAHVYLAKAYLQKADLGRAQSELETATSLPGSFKGEADALLQRVRALRTRIGKSSSVDRQ